MIWTPYTSNTVIDTLDRLRLLAKLLPRCISQQDRLFQDLIFLQVPHADALFSSIDIGPLDDWVFPWSGGDCDFDLGVGGCEAWECVLEEDASQCVSMLEITCDAHLGILTSCLWSCRPSRSSGSLAFCIGERKHQRHSRWTVSRYAIFEYS